MHTFFINTSAKSINSYDVLFDIHHENKTLVTLECPMADWYKKENGYAAQVVQMGDMIDGYVELNNAFNLIIYVDLPEVKAYAAIERDALHDREREACCRAMHILYTHVIYSTLVSELINSGRHPQNVLVLFGQEKKFSEMNVEPGDPNRNIIRDRLFRFMGIPERETLVELAKKVPAGDADQQVKAYEEAVAAACDAGIIPSVREQYREDLQIWYEEIVHNANVEEANEALFNRILELHRAELGKEGFHFLTCPYDTYACRVNKSALALSQLNLALHLLKCVAKESVTEFDPATEEQKVIPFRAYTMEEVAPLFYAKERIFAAKAAEIDSLAVSYADLGLAEHTLLLNHSRFGLDEFGHKAYDLVVIDAEKEEKKEEDEDTDPEDTEEVAEAEPLVTPIHKEVVVVHREGERLFTKDEYTPFDYRFEIGEEKVLRKDTKPAQFIERANKVRMHHLDYLKKLKLHVFRVLSNYAGKSKENKPALLQVGTKRYTSSSTPDPRTLEEVESVAEKAYDSMFDQYMEFCAGRSVAMTDIEEQCNWFASRIDQIEQSIKKITTVAVGLLVAILLLYIPYFVLQFSAIVENMLTVVTGLCSAAVPIVLLYVIFIILATLQKRKYLKAWNDFREKSNEALNGNAIAVEKYDKLLSVIIPALRWIYEYKLDVEYCAECCDIADAKVEHHRKKLRERVNAIRNILSDLEYRDDGDKTPVKATEDAIDYTAPFCTGKQNREFYTVINDSFFGNAAN